MDCSIEIRIEEIAKFISETHSTVREASRHFGISKSTIHKDMTERLPKINTQLYKNILDIILENKNNRHIRGGISTKTKYKSNKEKGEINVKSELTKREQQIINSMKDLRDKGVDLCTRQEIINNINIIERFVNYDNAFEKLECKSNLTISATSTKGNPVYLTNKSQIDGFKSTKDIKLINDHIGQGIRFIDIIDFTGIDKPLIYRFISKINKDDKFHIRENNCLCLTLQGFKYIYSYLDKSGDLTENQKNLLIELGNYIDNNLNLDKKGDEYEDLDEIFESLMRTVETIGTRISTFKTVKETKEEKIQVLERDKDFYKSKCAEYRTNVIRLQEKIDSLKWG